MPLSFEVPDEYPSVMLALIAYSALCYATTILIVKPARGKTFSKEVMATVGAEHTKAFPDQSIPAGGFPDMGSGRYMAKLGYKEWFDFNNAQRAHQNMVEQLPYVITFLMGGGLVAPMVTCYIAWFSVLMRIAYIIGYAYKGPDARVFGAVSGLLPMYGIGLYSAFVLIRQAVS